MVDFRIRGEAGVMAESRNVVRKKTEVEVLSVVDLSAESFFFVGDATQVDLIFFSEEIICVLSPRVNNASV